MATVKQALGAVARHAKVHRTAEKQLAAAREALRAAPAKGITGARLETLRAKATAASTKAHGERATRDQAMRAARDAGAPVKEIAAAAQVSESTVRNVISKGRFGRPSARAAAAAENAP